MCRPSTAQERDLILWLQERRAFENNRPTTLPLSFGENMNYVTFSTWWWSRDERRGACGSLVFLLLGMSVLVMLVFADYAMYQVVLTSAPAFTSGFGKAKEVGQCWTKIQSPTPRLVVLS